MRTPEQRRAYIDTARRLQPLRELERKARKAMRRLGRKRGVNVSTEGADLTLASHWRWRRDYFADATQPEKFCWNCHQFGRMPWNEETRSYSGPIEHAINCIFSPDNGPYPGWHAAGGRRS